MKNILKTIGVGTNLLALMQLMLVASLMSVTSVQAGTSYSTVNQAVHLRHASGNVIQPTNPVTGGARVPIMGKNGGLVPLNISYYLDSHPNVKEHIVWAFNGKWIKHADWQSVDKKLLDSYYKDMLTGDFNKSFPPRLFNSPLSGIIESDLKKLYFSHVAHAIWLEMAEGVSWRLHDYSNDELFQLLDGRSMVDEKIQSDGSGRWTYFNGTLTPSEALLPFKFALDNNIIGQNRLDTIKSLLKWAQLELAHSSDELVTDFRNNHQYRFPLVGALYPVFQSSTTGGSTVKQPIAFLGCHGASHTIRWVLRAVNIPAKAIDFYTAHEGVEFMSERLWLLHTDDVYAIGTYMDTGIVPFKKESLTVNTGNGLTVPTVTVGTTGIPSVIGATSGGTATLPVSFLYGHAYIPPEKFLIDEQEYNNTYKSKNRKFGDPSSDPNDEYQKRQFLAAFTYPVFPVVKRVVEQLIFDRMPVPSDWTTEIAFIKRTVKRYYHGPISRSKVTDAELNQIANSIAGHIQNQLKPIKLDKPKAISKFVNVKTIYRVAVE